jgi:hypothetical protein
MVELDYELMASGKVKRSMAAKWVNPLRVTPTQKPAASSKLVSLPFISAVGECEFIRAAHARKVFSWTCAITLQSRSAGIKTWNIGAVSSPMGQHGKNVWPTEWSFSRQERKGEIRAVSSHGVIYETMSLGDVRFGSNRRKIRVLCNHLFPFGVLLVLMCPLPFRDTLCYLCLSGLPCIPSSVPRAISFILSSHSI